MEGGASKYKILVFAHDANLYGASQSLHTLLVGLKDRYEILVLLPYGGKIEASMQADGINYRIVDFPRSAVIKPAVYKLKRRYRELRDFFRQQKVALPVLSKIADEFKPDLIYTNTTVVTMGYKIAAKLNIPHVWHVREFGWTDYRLLYLPYYQQVVGFIKRSAAVIFISKALYKHWFSNGLPTVSVIANGLIEDTGAASRKYPIGTIRFGILGAILPGKGQDVAIEAFSALVEKFPNSELHIYGDVVDKAFNEKLKQACIQFKIQDKVIFKGFNADKEVVYANLDVLLNCSVAEGFGRTIVEAMGRGIPVVANKAGGVPEIIDDGQTGLLYEATASSLSSKLIQLCGDQGLYNAISSNALDKAVQQYTVKSYVNAVNAVFNKVIQEKR